MPYRTFDARQIVDALGELWPYAGVSLLILLLAAAFGVLLGLLCAFLLNGKSRVLYWLTRLFMRFMRGAPAVVLLLLVFYGLPVLWQAIGFSEVKQINRFVAVVITFSLIASAQLANVFTAAYLAIPKAQKEAAVAVGYDTKTRFFRVILPQAARYALPNMANTLSWLIKEGAIAYTIGVIDLVGKAQLRISAQYGGHAIETYIALAILFFVLIRLLEVGFKRIEIRTSKHLIVSGAKRHE